MAQDFSNPVNYTVTAEDESTETFSVSVVKEDISYTLILNCQELMNMTLDGNYRLANNIDCSNLSFSPIGGGLNGYGCTSPFTGSFDGNGKIISNVTINSEDSGIGLFGCSSGNISNVGLINFNLSGFSSVGALVGLQIGGLISNSYSTGNITSSGGYSGGLVGTIRENGIISNCYSSANVTTSFWVVGGLVGLNDGLVFDSYSTGAISGESSTGGLIGHSNSGQTIESYWDKDTSLQNGSVGGIGKTTLEMKTPSTYTGWDQVVWNFIEGQYPVHWFYHSPGPEWSITYSAMNWDAAVQTCSNFGGRLPTSTEILGAFIAVPSEFSNGSFYFTNYVNGFNEAGLMQKNIYDNYVASSDLKTRSYPFKCIKEIE